MSANSTSEQAPGRSLADVAVQISFFEHTCLFCNRSGISLGHALAEHPARQACQVVNISTTVRNYVLADVVLDADTLIIFKNGHAISRTDYFEPAGACRQLLPETDLTFLLGNKSFILGYNNAHLGYQHWLTQCLPAIDWSLRCARTRAVELLLPPLKSWQEEFLELLGHDRIARFVPVAGKKYHLSHLEYSDFLNGATSFDVCMSARETAERVAHAVPPAPSDDRILYIDEENLYYGAISNRCAVIELLQRRGVVIVDPAKVPIPVRINLFRNADAVIGPLGEGLTNVLFCRPGALLWEWMPQHYQNASFNRLAQAAQIDYWGDMFQSVEHPAEPGLWEIDLELVSQRLSDLSTRLANRSAAASPIPERPDNLTENLGCRPIDELMSRFESIGDNCEFGLVQRRANSETLELLRFNGFHVPPEFRLEKLVAALASRFEGLAAPGTITVFPDGIAGQRELIVRESAYEFWYHTGIAEHTVELEVQCGNETKRLNFLRRKLLDDLATGAKIWVWKSAATRQRDQVQPLLDMLRSFGPNTLLWVTESENEHQPGTIEVLEPDLIRGYVTRFAPYEAVADIDIASWFEVCYKVDALCHPILPATAVETTPASSPQHLSAMQHLAQSPATPTSGTPVKTWKASWLGKLFSRRQA